MWSLIPDRRRIASRPTTLSIPSADSQSGAYTTELDVRRSPPACFVCERHRLIPEDAPVVNVNSAPPGRLCYGIQVLSGPTSPLLASRRTPSRSRLALALARNSLSFAKNPRSFIACVRRYTSTRCHLVILGCYICSVTTCCPAAAPGAVDSRRQRGESRREMSADACAPGTTARGQYNTCSVDIQRMLGTRWLLCIHEPCQPSLSQWRSRAASSATTERHPHVHHPTAAKSGVCQDLLRKQT